MYRPHREWAAPQKGSEDPIEQTAVSLQSSCGRALAADEEGVVVYLYIRSTKCIRQGTNLCMESMSVEPPRSSCCFLCLSVQPFITLIPVFVTHYPSSCSMCSGLCFLSHSALWMSKALDWIFIFFPFLPRGTGADRPSLESSLSLLPSESSASSSLVALNGLSYLFFTHLSKGGSSALRLDGDGLCAALEDLIDVLLTEFGPFILIVHDGPVSTPSQQILNLLLRQLLLRRGLRGAEERDIQGHTTLQTKIKQFSNSPPPGGSSQAVIPATHALQHRFVQAQLEAGAIKHLPLVRVPGDQTVHLHCLVLTNPVAASLGL
ncbi:hypothetical protein F7725_025993 [Dissostichus mawsoni]|uniref:Uncharacterized protein n=1 Tax=Dissostichus mawsoni TaxID=36200 RepID=A0A7J5X7B6_DISMA|nr:hypothetical protein F7725_025993 [Dissostichus mawsoni]